MANRTGGRNQAQKSKTPAATPFPEQRFALVTLDTPHRANVRAAYANARQARQTARAVREAELDRMAVDSPRKWKKHMQENRRDEIKKHHMTLADLKPHLPKESDIEYRRVGRGDHGLFVGETRVANIFFDENRFRELGADTVPGLAAGQKVWQKRGTTKQYVQDAFGNRVKRYVMRADDRVARTAPSTTTTTVTDEDIEKGFHLTPGEPLSLEQRALMQNLKGGGEYRRALSTTTSKYKIRSNKGEFFGGVNTVESVFDLAQVAPGSIYKGYDQTADDGLKGIEFTNKSGGLMPATKSIWQFRWSSAKNKEVYLFSDVSHAAVDRRSDAAIRAFPTL